LTRIESKAFLYSSLQSIIIPSNVEILCSRCFSYCESLSSISFESNSQDRSSGLQQGPVLSRSPPTAKLCLPKSHSRENQMKTLRLREYEEIRQDCALQTD
jgi:hypothetical protein